MKPKELKQFRIICLFNLWREYKLHGNLTVNLYSKLNQQLVLMPSNRANVAGICFGK